MVDCTIGISSFIGSLVGIAILIIIEDYILWKLWLFRYNSFLLATSPPSNEPLNPNSSCNSNYQTDKQSINKELAAEELNSRADKPKDKDNYRYADKTQYYEPYSFSVGF